MTDRLEELVKALEIKVSEMNTRVVILETNYKANQDFINDLKGYVKKFYYTVTVSLIAIILWVANAIIERVDIGL